MQPIARHMLMLWWPSTISSAAVLCVLCPPGPPPLCQIARQSPSPTPSPGPLAPTFLPFYVFLHVLAHTFTSTQGVLFALIRLFLLCSLSSIEASDCARVYPVISIRPSISTSAIVHFSSSISSVTSHCSPCPSISYSSLHAVPSIA